MTTPMMKQYLDLKTRYPTEILLFRMGDFYETFYDDAKKISKILNITLTSRSKSSDDRIPLAGFPWHALDGYLTKLVKAGCRIAICEQTEDPKMAKGLVKRDVIEVITLLWHAEGGEIPAIRHHRPAPVIIGDDPGARR